MRGHFFIPLNPMHQTRTTVARELEMVNQLIIEQLHSIVDMVENVGHYIVDAGGKRLRPLLVLLSASTLGRCADSHIKFAAIIEFIHTATLLHDDVVDLSALRRGRPTANAEFGNAPSVLVGDFLYTRAFQLMVQLGDMDILTHMAETTNIIAEGEVLQLVRAGDASTNEEQYLEVITRKTAILFAAACYGAATLSGESEETRQTLREFGLNLGIAFQMIDDVLDYDGDPAAMGKNVGDDLTEGKVTLPLIHTLRDGSAADQAIVRQAITAKSAGQIEQVIEAVKRCGSLDYTRTRARHYHDLALEKIHLLPGGESRSAMERIVELSINRDH
jgi:octaprenyl-diphosphate synthase